MAWIAAIPKFANGDDRCWPSLILEPKWDKLDFVAQDRKYFGNSEARRLKSLADELLKIAATLIPDLPVDLIGSAIPPGGDSAALISNSHASTANDGASRLAATARAIYRSRRQRARIFQSDDLFGEPAWDMMLDLFIAEAEGKPLSITASCIGSAVPSSTALRWLVMLEKRGLVERSADPRDARRVFLHLTARGRENMADCLQQVELLASTDLGGPDTAA